MMLELINWLLIERWRIKYAVRDWMKADTHKHRERREYYWNLLNSDYCGIRHCKISRHDLQRILQLRGYVDE